MRLSMLMKNRWEKERRDPPEYYNTWFLISGAQFHALQLQFQLKEYKRLRRHEPGRP